MDPFASGRQSLAALVADHPDIEGLNEATTRLRLIDRLLQECLGWHSADLNAERYHSGEFSDYELGIRAPRAILEAKKEGIYFDLPAGIAGRRVVTISTLCEDKDTKSALEQVARYCQTRGVPVGIICNGHQLVAFYASRQDGAPPMSGQALVFSSLDEMLVDFDALWNHLSRDGMAARNLQRALLGMSGAISPPSKLADQISNYPGFRVRSALETDLRMLSGAFIQDIENEESVSEEFLRECYCNTGALSQYAQVSREVLRNRYSAVSDMGLSTAPVTGNRGMSEEVPRGLVATALSRRPLILLGDVGVGKSMFLRHLLQVDAKDVLESAMVFYVNFGSEPAIETNLEEYVYRRITNQLLEQYEIDIHEGALVRAVYNGELNRFKKSLEGELAETDPVSYKRAEVRRLTELSSQHSSHLRRVLEHLRGTRGTQSVLVLDNIDQRSREFQDRVFVIAQALAETWPTTVFVALRPSTFVESKAKGSLAAYQLRVFTVTPTRVDEVILRRLDYAIRQVEIQKEIGAFPEHHSLSSDDLLTYLDVLKLAFTENEALNELLDNISGGNLRVALTYLSNFVGSGYVQTERVLDEGSRGGRVYRIPMHEFLRSMIFGEYDYYDPKLSEICNVFDLTTNDGREHFLLPSILAFVQHSGESAGGDSFVDLTEIYNFAQGIGFSQEQVAGQLERAIDKRLLEPRVSQDRKAAPLRVTSVGAYMYRTMPRYFVYLDAMAVDTPIVDVSTRSIIRDARVISERLDRGSTFIDYLDDQWSSWSGREQSRFDWEAISRDVRADISEAERKAAKAQRRRN